MSDELNLFQKFMFEAPGDDESTAVPPDESQMDANIDPPSDMSDTGPADVSDEPPSEDNVGGDDAPPDMGDGGFEDDSGGTEIQQKLDDKLSTIMNTRLYQTFLSFIGDINEQITTIKNNIDMFYTLSNESIDVIPNLKKLDENVRLYLKNTFVYERYEKNLLFFNKCINLYKLLGDKFNVDVSKGIKEHK
jgi:hypothetical protein